MTETKILEDIPIRIEVYKARFDKSNTHQISVNYVGREWARRNYDLTRIECMRPIIEDIFREINSGGYEGATRIAIHPSIIGTGPFGAADRMEALPGFFERLRDGLSEKLKLPVELKD